MLPDEVRTALKIAACEMYDDKRGLLAFKHALAEGEIDTEWEQRVVGSRGGILFRARISAEDGEYQVRFLMNVADLKRGAKRLKRIVEKHGETWKYLPADQFGELALEFEDLSTKPRRLH